ncbi:MAG: GNAT family N-acetyltransferase [Phycisphaeraceae bacterium]|nr:GNAT family N-acetyltransferase [Phycisphaeraceae bacterium]
MPAPGTPQHVRQPAPRCIVTLRDAQPEDVATLFAFESDPAWCAMAMVKPRTREAFDAIWEKIFHDRAAGAGPDLFRKVILADEGDGRGGVLCGSIGCHLRDGHRQVGYGLGRAHWGRGIATRALALLLAEAESEGVSLRPLHATAAATNTASIRVLTGNGFVITGTRSSPETDRYLACDEVSLVLV